MTRPRLEVAEVVREHGDAFLDRYGGALSPEQRRALSDIAACRTAALGGHVEACDRCGHRRIAYNSCRNRHCPKCQAGAAAEWMEDRRAELLPVDYFHVVFTLPAALGPIALQNPRAVYGLLFRAAAETLQQIAADPKHLGAEIGFLAVLHTWGQNLQHHPHVHCVVPGGGLAPDGSRWVACRRGFFLPVRVLSRVFRGKFLALLGAAFDRGKLSFHGQLAALADPGEFRRRLAASRPDRVGRLRQAPLRRAGAGAEVPGPVHPPGGDQQPAAGRPGGRRGHVPLEGLRPRGEAEDDDPEGDRVHPPVPPARPAVGVRADPALRLPGQPGVPGEAGAVPRPAGGRTCSGTRRGRARPRTEGDRRRATGDEGLSLPAARAGW